jgi:hypothetical protein
MPHDNTEFDLSPDDDSADQPARTKKGSDILSAMTAAMKALGMT